MNIKNKRGGANRPCGAPLLSLTGSPDDVSAHDFPGRFTGREVCAEFLGPGGAELAFEFYGPKYDRPPRFYAKATQKITVLAVTLEPVTTENSPEVYNPCGIATGGIGYYKINVEPAALFPDDKISWSVVSGDVSFVGNGGTGRLVAVKGGSTGGAFKLEVGLEGVNFPANPCIAGMVLEPKTVPVTVWIVRKDDGSAPARTQTEGSASVLSVNSSSGSYRHALRVEIDFSVFRFTQFRQGNPVSLIEFTDNTLHPPKQGFLADVFVGYTLRTSAS